VEFGLEFSSISKDYRIEVKDYYTEGYFGGLAKDFVSLDGGIAEL
jgi:hypothetical protein